MLQSSLGIEALAQYTSRQLSRFFPDGNEISEETLTLGIESAFTRLAKIHRVVRTSYYHRDGEPYFDHLNSDQYATYLYLLARHAFVEGGDRTMATKLYLLNKSLHSLDLYFEVEMPEIFLLSHPVGTVLGRASYGNYFAVSQNCTVGNLDGVYPVLGPGAVLGAGAMVLGRSRLGAAVGVGAGSLLINLDVPDNRTVVGRGKGARIIPKPSEIWRQYFNAEGLQA